MEDIAFVSRPMDTAGIGSAGWTTCSSEPNSKPALQALLITTVPMPSKRLLVRCEGTEGDRVAQRLLRRDAVLPFGPRRTMQQIGRPWRGGEGMALPSR